MLRSRRPQGESTEGHWKRVTHHGEETSHESGEWPGEEDTGQRSDVVIRHVIRDTGTASATMRESFACTRGDGRRAVSQHSRTYCTVHCSG